MKYLSLTIITLALSSHGKNLTVNTENESNISKKKMTTGSSTALELGLGFLGAWWGLESYLDSSGCSYRSIIPHGTDFNSEETDLLQNLVKSKRCGCLTSEAQDWTSKILKELGRRYYKFIRYNRGLKYDGCNLVEGIKGGWFANTDFHLKERMCQLFNPNTKSLMNRYSKTRAIDYLYCNSYKVPIPCTEEWQGKGAYGARWKRYCWYYTHTITCGVPGGSNTFNVNFKNWLQVDMLGYIKIEISKLNRYGGPGIFKNQDNSDCLSSYCMPDSNEINESLGCNRVEWDWTEGVP